MLCLFAGSVLAEEEPFYRPFVEDGKVWQVGYSPRTSSQEVYPMRWDYYYFDGDTIVGGQACKRMLCRHEHTDWSEWFEPWVEYTGALYEAGKRVYYALPGQESFVLLYDFGVAVGSRVEVRYEDSAQCECMVVNRGVGNGWTNDTPVSIGIAQISKGNYSQVEIENDPLGVDCDCILLYPWLEGIGTNTAPLSNVRPDSEYYLTSCKVGDELIYYNNGWIICPESTGIETDKADGSFRKRIDFTRVVKKAPKSRRRAITKDAGMETLSCTFSTTRLDIDFKDFREVYSVSITDEAGLAVYTKQLNTYDVLALQIDISSLKRADYTITVESEENLFTTHFNPEEADITAPDWDGDGKFTVSDITTVIDAYLHSNEQNAYITYYYLTIGSVTNIIEEYINAEPVATQPYTSQGDIEVPAVVDGKIRLSAQEQAYVSGANDFAFKLFRAIANQNEEDDEADASMILSPLSITYALGLVNNGASPKVSKEITSMLGFGTDGTKAINEFCANLIANAPLLDKEVSLNIANAFFLNSMYGFSLYDAFRQDMSNYYKALVEELDFSDPASCDHINAWGSKQTNGMIPKVLNELYPATVAYILNALYFKGTWAYQFNEEYTVENYPFWKEDKTHTYVPMMNAYIEGLPYTENNTCSAISLPYGNGAFSMTLLLPKDGTTVDRMMSSMTSDAFKQLQAAMTTEEVSVMLPRFETEATMPLEKIMAALGIPSAFNKFAFPSLCPEEADIFISKIFQKAKIKVNEEGSEAAAVTVIGMETSSIEPEEPTYKTFHADHPFVYLITERSTGAIFFMGAYKGRHGGKLRLKD